MRGENGRKSHRDAYTSVISPLFAGRVQKEQIECAVGSEALDDWFDVEGKGRERHLQAFRRHRAEVEAMACELMEWC